MPVIALVLSTLVMWLLFWYVRMGGLDHVREMLTRRKEEAVIEVLKRRIGLAPVH